MNLGAMGNESSDQVKLTGTKNLVGKTLEDDMFTFIVTDESGNVVASATLFMMTRNIP